MITSTDILHGKILIVDDQQVNLVLLERMLRGAGYVSITCTADPRVVCALHLANHYDLIMLDLQMPGMDGFRVMEDLKKSETNGYLPVLVVTAEPDHKLRALSAGARDFIVKPFDHAEVLLRVRNMLEVRLLHLEAKILYERIAAEQQISERLLLNVLPHSIAQRLKGRPEAMTDSFTEVIADSFPDVTVLFADIVEFTKFSAGVSAESLVTVLNDVFTRFDAIADKRGLEKIKTIGDGYMAAAGLPVPVQDHASRAADMALDMMDAMRHFNADRGCNLAVRVGLNTGPVVAGVIGTRKFLYDLWGDVVNTASRMESHGVAGRIQVTDSTRQRLSAPFLFEERGALDVKGKGSMHTWFLNGRTNGAVAMQASP
jgi:adenylate cyclase